MTEFFHVQSSFCVQVLRSAILITGKRNCTVLQERGQPKFAALCRGRHLCFNRASTTLGIGPDSSLKLHYGDT